LLFLLAARPFLELHSTDTLGGSLPFLSLAAATFVLEWVPDFFHPQIFGRVAGPSGALHTRNPPPVRPLPLANKNSPPPWPRPKKFDPFSPRLRLPPQMACPCHLFPLPRPAVFFRDFCGILALSMSMEFSCSRFPLTCA